MDADWTQAVCSHRVKLRPDENLPGRIVEQIPNIHPGLAHALLFGLTHPKTALIGAFARQHGPLPVPV